MWHLCLVGALAGAALTAVIMVVLVGRSANTETNTIAVVAGAMPEEAAKQAAAANVRASIPSVEAFYADHGTYSGATIAALRAYDPGIDSTVRLAWVNTGRYCVQSTVDGQTASDTGPGGDVLSGGC
jgi:hypothetical protein